MNMEYSASEALITEIAGFISELVPINVEQTKSRLSFLISKYHIKRVEKDEVHPDLHEKIQLFLSAKKLEGLANSTLDGYELDLNIFADKVKKKTQV